MSRDGDDDDDGFLGRWSRRKRQADHATPVPEQVPETAEPEAPAAEDATDEEVLARLELPHPETLMPGDDFTRYLKAPLSQGMKRLVLRRLWRSNPVLANLDGLNDYDTDFTGGGVAPGMLKSAYVVGRGYADRAVEALAQADTSDTIEDADPADPAEVDADPTAVPTAFEVGADAQERLPEDLPNDVEDVSEVPQNHAEERTARRMVFRFDD